MIFSEHHMPIKLPKIWFQRCAHLNLGGVEPPGDTGETGGRPSPSLEPVLAALLLAHAFSLGGGAGITFSGSLEELVEEGRDAGPGEVLPSLALKTSFSPERSPSRHRDPGTKSQSP